eukprot:scaffold703_cov56-Phaeocystis_antarctica.AAC.3
MYSIRALNCAPLAPLSLATFHHPARTSKSTLCPPFDSRQEAYKFNQPLSYDTSSVTDMYGMFAVRFSPCPAPNILQSSPALHAACTAVAHHPPAYWPAPRLAPYASWQVASAFNQPLSFDISSVTNMPWMFDVHSAPCHMLPICSRALSCTLRAPRSPTASRLPTRTSPRTVCPPFDSRQRANSLSNANKLLIRCAWAGTSAFNSGARASLSDRAGLSWPSGSCASPSSPN